MPRGKAKPPKADSSQPLPNFRGKLKVMDAKTITIEMEDHRVLDFRRTDKTKFYKNGDELKKPNFAVGDQVSVEGPEDSEGYLTAVNVYWEKSGGAAAPDATATPDAPNTSAGTKTTEKTENATAAAPERATEMAPPPAKADADDPGRPKLQRGRPADPAREHAPDIPADSTPPAAQPPQQVAVNRPEAATTGSLGGTTNSSGAPTVMRNEDEDVRVLQRPTDQLIKKAADAALTFTETLPDYFCQEIMTRYQSESHPASWQPIDVLKVTVVYEQGKEDYRDLTINGKATKKKLEESGGAWSTGEFGTVLIDLFSPATAADFHYRRDERIAGVNAKVYDYSVKRENSHWVIHQGAQTYDPAYKGSVWIDPSTSRVLRIEMQALNFPDEFPADHIESATDYEYIRIGDTSKFLLPVHAETLGCQRGTNFCSRNTIDFRLYHKYSGESNISFGDVKDSKDTKDKK
jgi:hypothetical protein